MKDKRCYVEDMIDLKKYLDGQRRMIDEKLDSVLLSEDTRPYLLHKAMRYSVFSGGKRLRPVLCLAAADIFDGDPDMELLPAVSVELLHTYTLVHDDLPCMDDDDTRRGQPTSHKVFGEANAVLTGDALQALAFEVLASASHLDFPASELIKELSAVAGSCGVVGGQVEDLNLTDETPDSETIEFIHKHKTADLFKAAIRMGCILACADEDAMNTMTSFAVNLGLAFQITDDLLDKDKKDDKGSCLAVYDVDKARDKGKEHISKAVSDLESLNNPKTKPLEAIANYIINRKY